MPGLSAWDHEKTTENFRRSPKKELTSSQEREDPTLTCSGRIGDAVVDDPQFWNRLARQSGPRAVATIWLAFPLSVV